LDLDDLIMFDGLASKIHVFLDLGVYSSSRKLNEMKVVLDQEMKNQIVIKIREITILNKLKVQLSKKLFAYYFQFQNR